LYHSFVLRSDYLCDLRNMISVTVVLGVLASLSSVSASCGHGLPWVHPFEPSARGTVAIPPFDYGLTTGPLNWHNLNNTFFLCGNGTDVSHGSDSSNLLALNVNFLKIISKVRFSSTLPQTLRRKDQSTLMSLPHIMSRSKTLGRTWK
jgi:hypothetical protein